jgi:hypothetical protein
MGIYDDASKRVGTGLYLKLDAGKRRIRIIEHPYVSNKPGFKDGDPIRTVFTWIVWNYDENRVQVLEQGPNLFKLIGAIIAEYGEDMPMECDLVITTTGSGIETKRTVVAVPKSGTMPPVRQLQEQDNGKNWPDLQKLTGGVPLARFAKEGLPEDDGAKASEKKNTQNDDVVLEDLPSDGSINVDDIPF